jgi:hypothetical protein
MIPSTQFLDSPNPIALQPFTTSYPPQLDHSSVHPSVQSFASYAARNPLRPIISPNQRPAQCVDKVSHHAAQVVRQQQQAEFLQDLTEFQATQSKAITDLAVKYHRKPQYMQKVLISQTHYKKKRATNLYNAKIAYKRCKLNEAGKFTTLTTKESS